MHSALRLGIAANLIAGLSLFGSTINTNVNNSAEIYTAGQVGGTALEVTGLSLIAGSSIQFSATGVVSGAGCTSTTPDGCGGFLSNSAGTGVSRYSGPAQALVGIFLAGSVPSGPDPVTFFAGTGDASFTPGLLQIFFIGDGLTGTGSGTVQNFVVPTGATRLFLGISDNPGFFHDNGGTFAVTATERFDENEKFSEAPEPSTYLMVGTAMVAFAVRRNRKK
jgi:PEP-CTERM motif